MESPKTGHFDNFRGSHFELRKFQPMKSARISQNEKIMTFKIVKMVIFLL